MKTIIVLVIVGVLVFYSIKSLVDMLSGKNTGCNCSSSKKGGCDISACKNYNDMIKENKG